MHLGKRVGTHSWPRSFLTRLKRFNPATSFLAKRFQRTGAQLKSRVVPASFPVK
jgi:hypothetical protein